MRPEDNSQLELFSNIKGEDGTTRRVRGSFFWYMRSYEKMLLLVIAFFICAIAAFSMGVERGKRVTTLGANFTAILPAQNIAEKENQVLQKKEETPVALPAEFPPQRYTIQIASYRSAKYAQQEADIWRKKGFTAMAISKGNFTILCIGNFKSQEAAGVVLSELKKQKRYGDSKIRRL